MRLIYMGTADFAVPALEKLHAAGHEISFVVTKPDVPKGRGEKLLPSDVKLKALELGLPVETPEKIRNNEEFLEKIRGAAPDFIIVAAYGKILPKEILEAPKYACLNIHGSLLPKYRGAAPIHRAVINGEKETGVTIMYMAEGMDTGDICMQYRTPVGEKTTEDLFAELAEAGADLVLKAIDEVAAGTAVRLAQNEDEASLAPMVFKDEGIVDYSRTADEICCKVRGFYSWPMASTFLDGQSVKLHRVVPGRKGSFAAPGTVISAGKHGIEVACGDGSVILEKIQMPGKKPVDAAAFLLGHRLEPGTVFTGKNDER